MSRVLEQRVLPGRGGEGLRRWLPVVLGLAVMYVPTYIDLARGLWQNEADAHGPIILAVEAGRGWRQPATLAGGAEKSAPPPGGAALASGLVVYASGRSQG